jgi:tRNA(fMet)-specific endonuclease VapC
MLWILDTDCLTLFQTGDRYVKARVLGMPPAQLATTIITTEEQLRGRLSVVRRAETQRKLSGAYGSLRESVLFFNGFRFWNLHPRRRKSTGHSRPRRSALGAVI